MGTSVFKTIKTVAKVGVLLTADAVGRKVMGIKADYEALKTDIEDLKTAVNGAMERIAQKVEELGEPDPDLGAIRTSLRSEIDRVSGMVAPSTEPTEPTEPSEPETGETSPGGFVEPGSEEGSGE